MLIKTVHNPTKNPYWSGLTPNEAYDIDPMYRGHTEAWAKKNAIPGPWHFYEVRVIKTKSDCQILSPWWEDPHWMEKIFWVYQKPRTVYPAGKQYAQFYALEWIECQRVAQFAYKQLGYNPFGDPQPSLYLPVDCCELCWDETKGGISEHLRPRAPLILTQEETDREERTQEIVKEKSKQIVEITQDLLDESPETQSKFVNP